MSVNIYNSNPNATSEEENFTPVADRGSKLASDTIYSNTTSGLTSVNVQDAIDEVNEKVEDNVEAISQINSDLTDLTLKVAQIIDTTDVYGNITLPASYNGKLIVSIRTTGELITYQLGYNITTPFIHFSQFDGSILANYSIGFIVYYLENNI